MKCFVYRHLVEVLVAPIMPVVVLPVILDRLHRALYRRCMVVALALSIVVVALDAHTCHSLEELIPHYCVLCFRLRRDEHSIDIAKL